MKRRAWVAAGTLALAAAYVTVAVFWRRAQLGLGEIAYDFYGLFYPNIVYGMRSIATGGRGMLWTPYQACGLPFFANSEVALLYPGHVVFALLPREPALLASILLHLIVAGIGTFLLCRESGLATPGALTGALAFQLGLYTIQFAGWGPIHLATWAWMPVAAWRAERLVRAPSTRNGVALAVVLGVQLLAGFIQISHFTYQLVAARVVWALATRESDRPGTLLVRAGWALVLGTGLAAATLLPALEMVRESIRSRPLLPQEIGPGFSWHLLSETAWSQVRIPFNGLAVALAAVAVLSVRAIRRRGLLVFHLLVVLACLVLSLGPGSGFWEVYAHLPFAGSFRGSGRLLWIAYLAGSVLVAFGADAAAGRLGRTRWVLPVAMCLDAVVLGSVPFFGYRNGEVFDRHADAFAFVRARLTPQDRIHIVGKPRDVALGPKSATWFDVPGIYDYEAQAPRRYAEFFTYLRTGRPLRELSDWHWILDQQLPPTLQRPLFDRTAARYLLVDRDVDDVPRILGAGVRLLGEIAGVRIYENEQALPRARWVPAAVAMRDDDVLAALARGTNDPWRTVVLDRAAPSATAGATGGPATISVDDPERVVVQVRTPAAALLVLADTFYPGWTATVNGKPEEIRRADYTFRAVAVPAGESVVEFVYRPVTVPCGFLVSALSAAFVVVVLVRSRGAIASGR